MFPGSLWSKILNSFTQFSVFVIRYHNSCTNAWDVMLIVISLKISKNKISDWILSRKTRQSSKSLIKMNSEAVNLMWNSRNTVD